MKCELFSTLGLCLTLIAGSAGAMDTTSFSALRDISTAPVLSDEQLAAVEGGELMPSPINIQVNPSLQVVVPTQVGINLAQNFSILSSNVNQSVQQGVLQFGGFAQH